MWVLPATANRALEFEWAGETHFHIEDATALPTRVIKRSRTAAPDAQASKDSASAAPHTRDTKSTDAPASRDTTQPPPGLDQDLGRDWTRELAGAPGAQASEARSPDSRYSPDVRVRFHDATMDAPHDRRTHADFGLRMDLHG